MPPELGYFHPHRESSTNANLEWLGRSGLYRRSTYSGASDIYSTVAGAKDEAGLAALENGDLARMEQLEAEADKLRLIARVLNEHFASAVDPEHVCLFVDDEESRILTDAEYYYYYELEPARSS